MIVLNIVVRDPEENRRQGGGGAARPAGYCGAKPFTAAAGFRLRFLVAPDPEDFHCFFFGFVAILLLTMK